MWNVDDDTMILDFIWHLKFSNIFVACSCVMVSGRLARLFGMFFGIIGKETFSHFF